MFMALFVPALMGALAAAMGSFIGRAIIALGIGFVTYKGIDLSIDAIKSSVMSAFVIAFAMRSLSGSVKKMEMK